jgi:sugar phosphate isomerase/epimerase
MHRLLPSTTSHKHEPLLTVLEVFSKLGLRDLDLNLHHLLEASVTIEAVKEGLAAGGQRVWMASGGWCEFFHREPRVDATFASVERQVALARRLGVGRLRLFFGRLEQQAYSPEALQIIWVNLRRLSDRYDDMSFVFENHDGASLRPEICREVLERVDRPNVRMNFDPINFERAGALSMDALRLLRPFIAHVHLKGVEGVDLEGGERGETCEFGAGDVDLWPVIRSLLETGYQGDFTVEYEGRFDRTVRLYEGFKRARAVLEKALENPVRRGGM